MIKFNYENSSITDNVINEYCEEVEKYHYVIHEKANDEKEFLG